MWPLNEHQTHVNLVGLSLDESTVNLVWVDFYSPPLLGWHKSQASWTFRRSNGCLIRRIIGGHLQIVKYLGFANMMINFENQLLIDILILWRLLETLQRPSSMQELKFKRIQQTHPCKKEQFHLRDDDTKHWLLKEQAWMKSLFVHMTPTYTKSSQRRSLALFKS